MLVIVRLFAVDKEPGGMGGGRRRRLGMSMMC